MARSSLDVRELTPSRFEDLERLFGPNGACGGCWCMWWRLTRTEYAARRGERNRRALSALVRSGTVPGLLAYDGPEPVGWVAVEPRGAYPRLARARKLKALDDAPVWSVTCLYVAPSHRRRGVTGKLLQAAVRHAFAQGAPAVEAYPVAPRDETPAASLYTGVLSTFVRAGFEVVARPSGTRAIVRRERPRARRRTRPPAPRIPRGGS